MPIEVLDNEETNNNNGTVFPEIISQHQHYILGAKLHNADFQFIDFTDSQKFSELSEGAFFCDNDANGSVRVGKKVNGNRKYLAYIDEVRAYVTEQVEALKPIVINPNTTQQFPISTAEKPIFKGKNIIFIPGGTFAGNSVEAGGVAIVNEDIPVGMRPTWAQITYNGVGNQVTITPIILRNNIRLDGSAGSEGVTEAGIANAITAVRNQLQNQITVLDSDLRSLITNISNRVTTLERNYGSQAEAISALQTSTNSLNSRVTQNEGSILELKNRPIWAEESVVIGNGTDNFFKIALNNKYITTPILIWEALFGQTYVRISQQDGQTIEENNSQYLIAAFAGSPAVGQFRVSIQGTIAA